MPRDARQENGINRIAAARTFDITLQLTSWQRLRTRLFLFSVGVKRRITLGTRAALIDGDRVFLIRQTYLPGWQFCGGGVEPGEDAELSASREMVEETGYRPTAPMQLFGLYHNTNSLTNRDHVALYNLLGDPALRVPRPAGDLGVELGPITREAPLAVTITLPPQARGRLYVSLDRRLGALEPGLSPVRGDEEPSEAAVIETHRRANAQALAEVEVAASGPTHSVNVPIPAGLAAGRYVLRAYFASEDGADRLGAAGVTIE